MDKDAALAPVLLLTPKGSIEGKKKKQTKNITWYLIACREREITHRKSPIHTHTPHSLVVYLFAYYPLPVERGTQHV